VHLVCAGALLWPAPGAETAKAPNFAPDSLTCWQLLDDEFIPPLSGPVRSCQIRAHPCISFYRYGESVVQYEGDTLVVNTIGISSKSYVDNYQTPHTDQLHVVERFHMIDDGKMLEVNVHVEDPGAFTTPWNAIQRYRCTNGGPLSEVVCAENNDDHFHHGLEPMPQADWPDF